MPADADQPPGDRAKRAKRQKAGPAPPRQSKASRERSAGVVVYRDVADDAGRPRRLYLLLDYGRHWDYPKGHLEPGEDDHSAALRELNEETGIAEAALVEGFSKQIQYHFRSSRKGLVRKEVIFFAARVQTQEVKLSEEHVGYAWLERQPALEQLTFENARSVLSAAADYLEEHDPLPYPPGWMPGPAAPEAS